MAWWAIGVYAFGLLALNAVLLFCAREAILMGKSTSLSRAIRFLYCEYRMRSERPERRDVDGAAEESVCPVH